MATYLDDNILNTDVSLSIDKHTNRQQWNVSNTSKGMVTHSDDNMMNTDISLTMGRHADWQQNVSTTSKDMVTYSDGNMMVSDDRHHNISTTSKGIVTHPDDNKMNTDVLLSAGKHVNRQRNDSNVQYNNTNVLVPTSQSTYNSTSRQKINSISAIDKGKYMIIYILLFFYILIHCFMNLLFKFIWINQTIFHLKNL